MTWEARIFVAGLGAALLFVILRALRTHRMRYEYSPLWILLGGGLIVLSLLQPTADRIARWVGIDYPPAFYLLLCLFVVLLFLFHLSLRLSILGDQMKDLAQQIALFTADLDDRTSGDRAENDRSDLRNLETARTEQRDREHS